MRTKILVLSMVSVALVACNNNEEKKVEASEAQVVETAMQSKDYMVPVGSTVSWEGHKVYVDWGHKGTLEIKKGKFHVENGELVGGSFTLDMNTINPENNVGDEKYAYLVGHLKSDDFFAVEQYPEGKFEITSVVVNANAELGTTHEVSGNLTLRDQTKNITVPARVEIMDQNIVFMAPEFGIDRKQWNVHYHDTEDESIADNLKEELIDDIMTISMEIEAIAEGV